MHFNFKASVAAEAILSVDKATRICGEASDWATGELFGQSGKGIPRSGRCRVGPAG